LEISLSTLNSAATRKSYTKPRVTKVALRLEEAVLGTACKLSFGAAGKSLFNGCGNIICSTTTGS